MENYQKKSVNNGTNSQLKNYTATLKTVNGISKAGKEYEYISVTIKTAMGDIPLTVWNSDRSYLALKMALENDNS